MQDSAAPCRDGATPFTLHEAAEVLGVSLNTLRRRIAAGQVEAERVRRPQGHVWQVYLHPPGTQDHRSTGTVQQDGAATVQHPPTALAQAEALTSLVQTTIGTVLGPLVAEQTALRLTVERQAEALAELREDRGRLSAELERAASTIVTLNTALEARTATQDAEALRTLSPPRWRSLTPWLLAVLALVVVVGLLGWPA